MTRQHILDEIRRTAGQNGGAPLGKRRFQEETGIRESDWLGKYWLKWSEAIVEAGYSPNSMNPALDEAFVLEKLASLVRQLGHYPVQAELIMTRSATDPAFPSEKTIHRLGRKAEAAAKLAAWCESAGGWDDVRAICLPLAVAPVAAQEPREREQSVQLGAVYLLKSGKYYKIGRSNSPGRRQYELSIQLPEPVSCVHQIATDDPVGIEQYWHQRFADRRKNGEWFELSREDVSAFKRRKFM